MKLKTVIMALLMSLLLASPIAMSANDNRFYVYNAANGLAWLC